MRPVHFEGVYILEKLLGTMKLKCIEHFFNLKIWTRQIFLFKKRSGFTVE